MNSLSGAMFTSIVDPTSFILPILKYWTKETEMTTHTQKRRSALVGFVPGWNTHKPFDSIINLPSVIYLLMSPHESICPNAKTHCLHFHNNNVLSRSGTIVFQGLQYWILPLNLSISRALDVMWTSIQVIRIKKSTLRGPGYPESGSRHSTREYS